MPGILDTLRLQPSPESLDYVSHKTQFHLHTLLTEQRHPRTWDLGFVAQRDTEAALRAILAVDDDLEQKCEALADAPGDLERLAAAIDDAIAGGHRVYFYGCGATGRLAKQMESTFWRPFWERARASLDAAGDALPSDIADRLTGEMTGADRALVSSLEGFEDLPQLGELQLEDHGIQRGDVVVCVTEGGETSSVIGTILAARAQYGRGEADEARTRLYFAYNNPDEVLRPFDRSRTVLDEPGITRIPLATGPQAVAGSTRMQATTIETFVLGAALEEAMLRILRRHLSTEQIAALGFTTDPGIAARLREFAALRRAVARAVPALAKLTELESATYQRDQFSLYFARAGMITVFIDCTERSPTFRLFPLDEHDAPERRCWVQVWTEGADAATAWHNFLGRPFRGLSATHYQGPLEQVEDPYLRRAALDSLTRAGNDQEQRYDFSFSPDNIDRRGPGPGDLGVLVLVDDERAAAEREGAPENAFAELCGARGAELALIRVGAGATDAVAGMGNVTVDLDVGAGDDPIQLRRQIALKILLNAHSTATMARCGRVVGNTMTNVSPSNLKLIGRATFLIQSHVNDTLAQESWTRTHGQCPPVEYAEANAVLYDAIAYVQREAIGQTAEVAMCIVRILESLRKGAAIDWHQARAIVEEHGLAAFLQRLNPALGSAGGE